MLIIRLELWITNYPSLSPGKLHIAHLLWGGVFMTTAIWMLASYIGRRLVAPAAIIGGVGFGFFIDEVGKFVTADNDYFFKPTATIIYLVFMALFLTSRWIGHRQLGEQERLGNAAVLASERFIDGMSPQERQSALALLQPLGDKPEVLQLRRLVGEMPTDGIENPGRLERIVLWMGRIYASWVRSRWFQRAMIAAVTFGLGSNLLLLVAALFFTTGADAPSTPGYGADGIGSLNIGNIASVISIAVSSLFGIAGIASLIRGRRIGAYKRLRQALLVTIFVTYPFVFAENSFSAVTGLLITLAAFGTLSAMLREEERIEGVRELGEAKAAPAT